MGTKTARLSFDVYRAKGFSENYEQALLSWWSSNSFSNHNSHLCLHSERSKCHRVTFCWHAAWSSGPHLRLKNFMFVTVIWNFSDIPNTFKPNKTDLEHIVNLMNTRNVLVVCKIPFNNSKAHFWVWNTLELIKRWSEAISSSSPLKLATKVHF